jgi:carbonic anhydrase/acetyltransferase-like protein (isoleucine patch superfamily)
VLHVDPGYPMSLGPRVTIGHKVMLHGCSVGEGTLIGINSVVMNGARIGRNSLIGANTLIAEGKEIPDGVLVLGSPGKVVRDLRQEEKDYLLKIAQGYVDRSRYYQDNLKEIT